MEMIIMKKIILLSILIMTIISCTETDRRLMREADREERERGVECTYNKKVEITSCYNIRQYIKSKKETT